ncbi:MAG: hypothetical protein KY468_07305 [Armatimonadetes bacterium]|nr:hypothetical protein [Armatimonadota bacterium]
MGYYVRVFCTGSEIPPLNAVLEWCAKEGVELKPDEHSGDVDLTSPGWYAIGLLYKEENSPLVVDLNRGVGIVDCLFQAEINEFLESLEEAEDSSGRSKVLSHLKSSKYIVAVQLLNDIDDDGFHALDTFTRYFVEKCGGMVQADGEGFYDGDRLILEC